MLAYYFEMDDGNGLRDLGTSTLPNPLAARDEAYRRVAGFAGDPGYLARVGVCVVTVRDISGAMIWRVRFVCACEPDTSAAHGRMP